MSFRSLLTRVVLATAPVAAMASPHSPRDKTVTVTEIQTVTAVSAACSASLSPSVVTAHNNNSTTTPTTSSSAPSNTNPTTTLVATATATDYGLDDAARAAGKLWFGTAADIPGTGELEDVYYMAQFNNTHDFGGATPANVMKFEYTQPQQGVFNFTGGDAFLDLAEAAGKRGHVRCHNLVWYNQLPGWLTDPPAGKEWTSATLLAVLETHVARLVRHFGDRCYSWDVVNEALADDITLDPTTNGTTNGTSVWQRSDIWQSNIWYDTIGPGYVPAAFAAARRAAAAANLSVRLYYNDYGIESAPGTTSPKTDAALALVAALRREQGGGIPLIDGVGLESHFVAGDAPARAAQEATMRAFAALGVDVAVTELDVRVPQLPADAASEALQVEGYRDAVAACAGVERCVGVTVWDFDDTYSWIPSTFAGQGYGDLFLQPDGPDTPLVKKAAYDGCLEALTDAAEAP